MKPRCQAEVVHGVSQKVGVGTFVNDSGGRSCVGSKGATQVGSFATLSGITGWRLLVATGLVSRLAPQPMVAHTAQALNDHPAAARLVLVVVCQFSARVRVVSLHMV